jgi:hypothetical protein
VDGLDDPYPEIADFLAEQVLPLYGKAILPGLQARFDAKGGIGDARRLKLLHALDPAATRDLITQALDGGSKEVRVAAIECLGGSPGDLPILIEQVSAKAKEVRAATYRALAAMDDPAAADVLKTAIAGKDLELAAAAIARSTNDSLPDLLIAEIAKIRTTLPKLKDKQEVSELVGRMCTLIAALPLRQHPAADKLTLDLFAGRDEFAKVKGADKSGADVVDAVVQRMADGHAGLQTVLARAHAELDSDHFSTAFRAARRVLPPAELYEAFSRYLEVDEHGSKTLAAGKRQTILILLGGNTTSLSTGENTDLSLDSRWLDLALRIRHVGLVHAVGRPGHAATETYLQEAFNERIRTAKSMDHARAVLHAMVRLRHPTAADALVAFVEKEIGRPNFHVYLYSMLIPDLPKAAIHCLETVVPKLNDRDAKLWLAAIDQLRAKE